ncbi:nicotinate-nucleotide pyrophosphorylase (carboxylating) [Syntrophobotulus glycolicus DSM 8271]|uniref:Probable nicotinate-nucleotide pyrophosphorylase [carboxylating] n=1 Tax=Syntrophobotulus glycolicus (strain DSM 8271 / FlGlyR) TaxID=645991 RepID=F0SWA8_SYNGF|nr:carboxylating nicotinate-nucleotide diphosphorylase [Syntrophobotulus glycolicus]ADY54594.1 nicotinate-nucleotide pyrophosphorylase (carboxylating) [Syntrophobotulus glycolicus DSM 8271]
MNLYEEIIDRALKEDIGTGDLSSQIIPEDYLGMARIYAKEHGVVCGLQIAEAVFKRVDPDITIEFKIKDGDLFKAGDLIMSIQGPLGSILQAERTALNFLQHLSGISSYTRLLVDKVSDLGVKVVDTRKTIPGMRVLQKYAIRVGGGQNHRLGLYDAVMLKDNHHAAVGGLEEAISRVKAKIGHMVKIEVECETLEQVEQSVNSGVDVIMLDNMNIEEMKTAVRSIAGRAITEASGGITEENIREIAETGVDVVSVGKLTNYVKALDFSLVVDESKPSMKKYAQQGEKV